MILNLINKQNGTEVLQTKLIFDSFFTAVGIKIAQNHKHLCVDFLNQKNDITLILLKK